MSQNWPKFGKKIRIYSMYKINTKEELELFLISNLNEVHKKIDQMMEGHQIPFYSSVDIRESKNKFAPIDHNMYPAGFNNICSIDLKASIQILKESIQKYGKNILNIAIHPESHTKNTMYLENVYGLGEMLKSAGFNVFYISFDLAIFENNNGLLLETNSGKKIQLQSVSLSQGKIITSENELKIDLIILNHDQSNPLNIDWQSITIPVVPPYFMGWNNREKNSHFKFYEKVVNEFCSLYSINPDLIMAKYDTIEDVDFSSKVGIDRLAQSVNELKTKLPQNSKIFVKASKGTYGMGIMVVENGEEIININRKERNKMDIGKNKIKFTSLLIQEGVETVLKYDSSPAEITMYLVGGKCIGGFMRANTEKDANQNLNSKGMIFIKFCMSELKEGQDHKCRECTYSTLARLSTLASCYEIEEQSKKINSRNNL